MPMTNVANSSMGSTLKDQEYHVASFVVQVLPQNSQTLSEFISQHSAMEVHAISPQGKIVFTVEGNSHKYIANQTDAVKQHPAVLTLSPVYHQFLNETPTATNEGEL